MSGPALDDAYVIEHVRQALATDERTNMQGLRVTRHGDCVVISGTVESTERRSAVEEVAAEAASSFRPGRGVGRPRSRRPAPGR